MKEDRLQGVWSCPSLSHPDHPDTLVINDSLSRIVLFATVELDPFKRIAMKLWCEIISPGVMKTKVKPHIPNSNQTEYILDEDILIMTTGTVTHTCTRLPDSDIPSWLQTDLAKAYAIMDQRETEV